jgi:peptidyl-prolyl cis-trans isomerase C
MMKFGELTRSWLREPLVHFLIAGLAVFLFSAWRGGSVDPESRTISITSGQVQALTDRWMLTWQRTPTQNEIDGLIRDYIKEEVYSREAKRMGLDEDDIIIRRRLRMKMEALATAEAESADPDDATLQAWLDKHPQKYAREVRYSFDQIYLNPGGGVAAQDKAMSLLSRLREGAEWQGLGDRISLQQSLQNASTTDIIREFGDDFAGALKGQEQGKWIGPIQSGFGQHLVRIRDVTPSEKPILSDVRQSVSNDWRQATVKERESRAYQALLDGYTIRIAKP